MPFLVIHKEYLKFKKIMKKFHKEYLKSLHFFINLKVFQYTFFLILYPFFPFFPTVFSNCAKKNPAMQPVPDAAKRTTNSTN